MGVMALCQKCGVCGAVISAATHHTSPQLSSCHPLCPQSSSAHNPPSSPSSLSPPAPLASALPARTAFLASHAQVAVAVGVAPCIPGMLAALGFSGPASSLFAALYDAAWFVGAGISTVTYVALMALAGGGAAGQRVASNGGLSPDGGAPAAA